MKGLGVSKKVFYHSVNMFLDEATIIVKGGTGGRGCVSWRREKYEPMGGPDGGDGGDGGTVRIRADRNTDTLSAFVTRKTFAAENGKSGSGSNRGGKDGEDLCLLVPPGTLVYALEQDKRVLVADLTIEGSEAILATGGRGGYGNAHFVSSTRQAPDFAEVGEPGVERTIHLELKLVADVGIIGYPNVGKSTLIAAISAARPKIADYPFTTLVPNLGVATISGRSIVVCDIPGLIEGASEGKGLGHTFLRHIERCGMLLHLLDISRAMREDGTIDAEVLVQDYRAIRHELKAFSKTLSEKKEIVALSKCDLTLEDLTPVIRALKKKRISALFAISAASGSSIDALLETVLKTVLAKREERQSTAEALPQTEAIPILRPHEGSIKMDAYTIETSEDGSVSVYGKRIEQFTVMTDFNSEGGIERFRDVLDRIGLRRELQRLQTKGAKKISIGSTRVDDYL